MKRSIKSIVLVLVLLTLPVVSFAQMATVTITTGACTLEVLRWNPNRPIYQISWTANTTGTCTVSLEAWDETGFPDVVEITRVVTNPSGGDDAPSDNYDITLTDQDGLDLFAGLGANRDETNSEQFAPVQNDASSNPVSPFTLAGPVTLSVTTAGVSTSGIIRIYTKR